MPCMPPRVLRAWVVSMLATACTPTHPASEESGPAPSPIDAEILDGRTFFSVSVGGYSMLPDTHIRLDFGDDGSFRASAGCNVLESPVFGITTGVLDVDRPLQTMMYCGEARGEQDAWLAAFLSKKPAWSLEGPRLTLRADRVTIVLIEEDPPAR